jgi:Ca2+-binding RTX toxin-like protein
MASIMVPGAVVDEDVIDPFNARYNQALAQSISVYLFAAQADKTLLVKNDYMTAGTVHAGGIGEIAVTTPGATYVDLPAGFSFTAIDQSVPGPFTVTGGGSLFIGDQNTTYWGKPASGTVSIAAGDGNDLISLPVGTFYDVAMGSGNDTVNANGSGTVTGGSGKTLLFVGAAAPGGSADHNIINSYGANDTIVAGAGSATINAYGANTSIFGGSGSLEYLGNSPGQPTIWGGSGTETLFGSAGQNITYLTGAENTSGADILVAGEGNETLNAGAATIGVQLAAGPGPVTMIGSSGNDHFFGGSNDATMTGNGGDDIFSFATAGFSQITDFNTSNDIFSTVGYGPNAAQAALASATVIGGNTLVMISGGPTIVFENISNTSSIKYTST